MCRKLVLSAISLLFGGLLLAQPTITSFTPQSGVVGSVVTIVGTGFNTTPANNVVIFGATRATVTAATATQLTVTVPAGATYAPITVLNSATGLITYSGNNFMPTFSPAKSGITVSDFNPKKDFVVGGTPISMAISDLNGDGRGDLVVINNTSNSLSILRNNSNIGSIDYLTKVDLPTGIGPTFVAIGDLNGDGKADLAVTNYLSSTVSVFQNISSNGNIDFAPKVDFPTGVNSYPQSVAIGDLDGDGKLDLAVAKQGTNTVSVFHNIGSIGSVNYTEAGNFVTGHGPKSIAVADLDGDGKADLAVANSFANSVSILRNTSAIGSMSFATKADYGTGLNPYSVAIGDLDGDSKQDLVIGNNNRIEKISVLRNTSSVNDISFSDKIDFEAGYNPVFVAVGDLDGDSRADLVVANQRIATVSALHNTGNIGNINFATKVDFETGGMTSSTAIGDMNGDGKSDIVAANWSTTTVSVFQNRPSQQTIQFSTLSPRQYGSSSFTLTATATSGLPVSYTSSNPSVASISGSIISIVGAGSAVITARQFGNSTWAAAPIVQQTLVVNKAPLTVTANNVRVYGSANFPPISVSYSGFVNGENASVIDSPPAASTTAINCSSAGSYPITLTSGSDNNYTITTVAGTLTVTKAILTATVANNSKAFGAANPALSFVYSGFVCGDNSFVIDAPPTIATSATNCSNAGTYPITLSGGVDNNYTIVAVNGTLTVNKANLTVTADNKSKTYNTPNPALTFSYSGFVCSDNASVIDVAPTVSTSATTTSNAGTYPITLTGGSDNNYNLSFINGTLTINKANQTISFSPIPTLCTYATHSLVASSSSGLPITFSSSDVTKATISGSTLTAVAHGTPTITATQAGNLNFNPASASQVVTINPNPTASISGGNAVCFGATTTLTAQPGGSGFTYVWSTGATSQTISVGSGTYTVTVYKNGCSGTSSTFVEGVDCSGGGDPCPDPNNPNCPCTGPYCARRKGVQNNDIPGDFIDKSPGIYPNPAVTDYFILLEEPGAEATQVTMTDVSGKVVRQTQIEERMWAKKVNVADLPTGLYVVRLTQNNKSLYYRLLISR